MTRLQDSPPVLIAQASGDRTFKLAFGTTFEYGRYVESLRGARDGAARARVLGWEPERLVIAHGACAEKNATQIPARALAWI